MDLGEETAYYVGLPVFCTIFGILAIMCINYYSSYPLFYMAVHLDSLFPLKKKNRKNIISTPSKRISSACINIVLYKLTALKHIFLWLFLKKNFKSTFKVYF